MPDGEQTFRFEAGNLALDFLNTVRISRGDAVDGVRTATDLEAWLDRAGPSPGSAEVVRSPPAARVLLAEAHGLRCDVRRLVEAHVAGEDVAPHVLYGINRVLNASPVSASLRLGPEGAWLVTLAAGEGPLAALGPIARAAAELLVHAEAGRVRQCASAECLMWFVDSSKGGRRRWCSMATCGNRAKAAKHRSRTATK